jgi:SAM-dependent methyltransferase
MPPSLARSAKTFLAQLMAGELNLKMLRYHLVEKLLLRRRGQGGDDFNWSRYHLHYQGELELASRTRSLVIGPGDYTYSNSKLMLASGVPPLHPNIHIILETILQLQPGSVLEIGCGGGDHLHNLRVLQPSMDVRGVDVSLQQLEFLCNRHPELASVVAVCDITEPVEHVAPADLVYTNAVLMHISPAGGRWERAIRNLFRLARHYIVLTEHWTKHEYVDFMKHLAPGRDIPWPALHLFHRSSAADGFPGALVASHRPLPYAPLLSSSQLVSGSGSLGRT